MRYLMILLLASCAKNSDPVYTIQASVFGDQLTMSTSNRMAGAIQSFNWRGQEFLNSVDHGREMQTDIRIGYYGECYNPTEAGSRTDVDTSTSILRRVLPKGNELFTTTQLGFWLTTNDNYIVNCPLGKNTPRATTNTSLNMLEKHVTIGAMGLENVIEVDERYFIAEDAGNLDWLFEGLVTFMNPDFNTMYIYNADGSITKTAVNGAMHDSIIVATADGKFAMSSYVLEVPPEAFVTWYGYGINPDGYLGKSASWSDTFYTHQLAPGWYSFKTLVIIGTLDQVQQTLNILHRNKQ